MTPMCIKMASKRWNMTFVVSTNFVHKAGKVWGWLETNWNTLLLRKMDFWCNKKF